MSECEKDCGNCDKECAERAPEKLPLNSASRVERVVAVASGKGGVGKSTVTAGLAVAAKKAGHSVGILDADITGPSIPKMFGVAPGARQDDRGIIPADAAGIKIMSMNLLLQDEESPVLWRGPILGGAVGQFWTDVCWGELDFLFLDMPPGTGDIPLTVYQSVPVDGVVLVSTPQDLVSMIVKKAYAMAEMMNIPVLGLVENMTEFVCPHCGKSFPLFGRTGELAAALGVLPLAELPFDPRVAALSDEGRFAEYDPAALEGAIEVLERIK